MLINFFVKFDGKFVVVVF